MSGYSINIEEKTLAGENKSPKSENLLLGGLKGRIYPAEPGKSG